MKIQPVRGTHDIFGNDLLLYTNIEKIIDNFAEIYDYKKIITPIFEDTNLFKKPLGDNSDVVLKEMYSFQDRNESILTLRPEYTTPMIRASISNNLLSKLPIKLYGLGPMFRRERPQKGRYRQFNQINFEILGTDDVFSDAEIITLADRFLKKLISKEKFILCINSLGEKNTINKYKDILSKYFEKYKNDLSSESQKKISTNPLRILDSNNKIDQKICKEVPKIKDLYSNDSKKKFEEIKVLLTKLNVEFTIDESLVRGLDYYCHTVFEFKSLSDSSQNTLIGGGRYDGLVKLIGGPDIPGVGWASGVERLMQLSNKINIEPSLVDVIILDKKYKEYGMNLIDKLRERNIKTSFNYRYNLKKSLSNASLNKTKYAIIIGDNEFKNKNYTLKNLADGNQKIISLSEIINKLIT